MALGAITPLPVGPGQQSGTTQGPIVSNADALKFMVVSVVGDASYPTGGSVVTPAQLTSGELSVIVFSQAEIQNLSGANSAVASAFYNLVTGKLQCFGASAEIANATNLSGATFNILILGY